MAEEVIDRPVLSQERNEIRRQRERSGGQPDSLKLNHRVHRRPRTNTHKAHTRHTRLTTSLALLTCWLPSLLILG